MSNAAKHMLLEGAEALDPVQPRVCSPRTTHRPPGGQGLTPPSPPPGTARAVESNRYELDFYEEIKDLFWRRIAAHPKKSKLRTSYWMDFP